MADIFSKIAKDVAVKKKLNNQGARQVVGLSTKAGAWDKITDKISSKKSDVEDKFKEMVKADLKAKAKKPQTKTKSTVNPKSVIVKKETPKVGTITETPVEEIKEEIVVETPAPVVEVEEVITETVEETVEEVVESIEVKEETPEDTKSEEVDYSNWNNVVEAETGVKPEPTEKVEEESDVDFSNWDSVASSKKSVEVYENVKKKKN